MKTLTLIIAFVLSFAISLGQSTPEASGRDPHEQIDSFRNALLAPKLKQYGQRAERLTELIGQSTDKRCTRQLANRLADLSNNFMGEVASLYECYAPAPGTDFYVGAGFNPWYNPGLGGFAVYDPFYRPYFGPYYSGYGYYPYSRSGYNFDCLPTLFYDVAKVKKYANSMSTFANQRNVSRKLGLIEQRLEMIKQMVPTGEREAEPVSVK